MLCLVQIFLQHVKILFLPKLQRIREFLRSLQKTRKFFLLVPSILRKFYLDFAKNSQSKLYQSCFPTSLVRRADVTKKEFHSFHLKIGLPHYGNMQCMSFNVLKVFQICS